MIFTWTKVIWIHSIRIDCFLIFLYQAEDLFVIGNILNIHSMEMTVF